MAASSSIARTCALWMAATENHGKNRYARDYTYAYRDFIGSQRVLFSRAGFFPGQHTVPMHWGGDQQAQNAELRSQLHAGLSAAASGILFWGFDIAGFAGPLPTLDPLPPRNTDGLLLPGSCNGIQSRTAGSSRS